MDAILSNSAAANNPLPMPPDAGASGAALLRDHSRRVFASLDGFRVYGAGWLRPWATYCVSPVVRRLAAKSIARFDGFNVRLSECDLYTFANVFADYPINRIARALGDVELIVDLGANVGAFSYLMRAMSAKKIIAVEPDADNVAFLREQPFAKSLEIHQAAVGPLDGTARLIAGNNSVTHHVDLSSTGEGPTVPVMSLESLCPQPALVKMDIEGGEKEILRTGLPENVRYLVLEWHHPKETPADFISGNWEKISTDFHGASNWFLQRRSQ
jgi:FkbM family methyltransferase